MRIAKEFNWEMGHRLPFHSGKCKNLHGHSYKLIVELEGDLNENGMLIDFYDLKEIINPIIDELDHSFLVYKNDIELLEFLKKINSKYVIIENHSTCENICKFLIQQISQTKIPENISSIKLRVYETADAYAEEEMKLK